MKSVFCGFGFDMWKFLVTRSVYEFDSFDLTTVKGVRTVIFSYDVCEIFLLGILEYLEFPTDILLPSKSFMVVKDLAFRSQSSENCFQLISPFLTSNLPTLKLIRRADMPVLINEETCATISFNISSTVVASVLQTLAIELKFNFWKFNMCC